MRHIFLSAIALSLFLSPRPLAGAEKKPSRDNSNAPTITEIGGKTFDQWLRDLKDTDPGVVENAIRTIVLFGPESKRALPILVKKLKNPYLDVSIKVNVAIALRLIGLDDNNMEEGVRGLNRLLSDSEALVKYQAILTLGSLGSDARKTIENLKIKLHDPRCWEVRMASAQVLRSVAMPGPKSKKGPDGSVIEALRSRSRTDTCAQVRLEAIQSLVMLGPPVSPPTLRLSVEQTMKYVALNDRDKTVRIWAHVGVMRMSGKIEQERLAAIGKQLTNPVLGVRCQAARALGGIGTEAKTQIDRLVYALNDRELFMVTWSLWALGQMGKSAMRAVPDIEKLAKTTKNEALKKTAEDTIKFIQKSRR